MRKGMAVLSEDLKNRIRAYIPKYPRKQAVTLPALHLVHDEMRTVSNEAIVEIAELLELHSAEVQDTMTFYQFFKGEGEKLGDTRLWVCRGLACMLRGAYELIEHCEHKLGVRCGETTPDGKITLEFAECIGACDGAPACLRNDVHVMNVTPEKADKMVEDLQRHEERR
jgi:NADH-quinone oxidoreductase subunit E